MNRSHADGDLPQATQDPIRFENDLRDHGLAFHADFLGPAETAALRDRVLEQLELELEQGVAIVSETGSASEMQFAHPIAGRSARFRAVHFRPNKRRVFIDLMQDTRANTKFVYPFVPELRRGGLAGAVPRPGMRVSHAQEQARIV